MAYDHIPFTHTTLSSETHHIRLLKSRHTAPNEPLRLSLESCKLSDDVVYNALSYEWGSNTPDKRVFVNDQPFLIRANLHDFLWILASSEVRNALFFADAICINQEDIPERNNQVQHMSELYRKAAKVLIWLGPGSAESDLILDMCVEGKQDDIDFQGSTGEALNAVYERSYWTRLWIIQELSLAREGILFCGLKAVSWSEFRRLTTFVKGDFAPGGFTGWDIQLGSLPRGLYARDILDKLEDFGKEENTLKDTIDDLIVHGGLAQCMDIRDRVYGLLGLARVKKEDKRGVQIKADYSVTPATLFFQLLSNMPYALRLKHALKVLNILDLHHANESEWDLEKPDKILDLAFEVGLTHLGHVRHTGFVQSATCEPCMRWNKRDNHVPFEPDEDQQRVLGGKTITEFVVGDGQLSLAAHNCGPLLSLGNYKICINEGKPASEGDEIFLLEESKIVLIRHQANPNDASDKTATIHARDPSKQK
ncbi:hypothetical protein PENANT_c011G05956 [Penicillium antarcticum]|uniref:Heterokaryon incompatibility domain-containing protein n=1 Tax=Penicillium antarcticum TaxID=416450 RepID=A0A1V6Q784_9EURO|nr:uncharacterized protein N7508_003198 [Penicillium antarcticum]KAJ5312368.1 hypothetical protein N7508_003198 [Penicillium antarcticum]OQD85068.1 hypothetical protein PENANT_c011G05956 [Penicillium antarcticum]